MKNKARVKAREAQTIHGMIAAAIIIVVLLSAWAFGSWYIIKDVEHPAYHVLQKHGSFEIRTYAPYIMAQVKVEGDYSTALNKGFTLIANYIFGNNVKKSSIAMTAPVVEQAQSSENIAMTAPVLEKQTTSGSHLVSFIMPSKYTLKTLPKPNNAAITFVESPKQTMAVLVFYGPANTATFERKKKELLALVIQYHRQTIGAILTAGYNPPFTFPLLIHNEVLVPVKGE